MRIGLIGCGGIAEHMHAPAIDATEGVSVQWVMDTDRSTAKTLASQFDIGPVVEDIPAATSATDAVIITTPPHVRPDLTQAAIDAGYHVLAEKPLGNTIAECNRQVQAAKNGGKILACSHQYRFWPSRCEIKRRIDEQSLGPVRSVSMSQGKPYSWVSKTGYTMLRDQVPGGVLINAGIHPLDTMLWWLGDPIDVHYTDDALGGLESNFKMHLEFDNEVRGVLLQSRTSNVQDEIRVVCRDGEMRLSTYSRLAYSMTKDGAWENHTINSSESSLQPAVDQLIDFRDAVSEGRPPRVPGAEAARCIDVIEKCYVEKRRRPLPDVAPIPGQLW